MNAALILLLFKLGSAQTVSPDLAVWPDGYKLMLRDDLDKPLPLNDSFDTTKLASGTA